MATDAHPEVMRRLRHNAEANGGGEGGGAVEVQELDWVEFGEEKAAKLGKLVREKKRKKTSTLIVLQDFN